MPWIWLDATRWPQYQNNFYNVNSVVPTEHDESLQYCVAEFRKALGDGRRITKAKLTISADSFFHLYVNGEWVGLGPAAAGGDFLCTGCAPRHYQNTYELPLQTDALELYIRIRLLPEVLTDYARGHGGLFAQVTLWYEDGTTQTAETDGSWLCRPDIACTAYRSYDSRNPAAEYAPASVVEDIWHAETAPIPMLTLQPVGQRSVTLSPGETRTVRLETDRIWGAYPGVRTDGACRIALTTCELEGQQGLTETLVFTEGGQYRSFRMHSLSILEACIENASAAPLTVELDLVASWYPITAQGSFCTSEPGWDRVYDVCKHTLQICRQTLHLDSTSHQELMACTGDYYIESLMTFFCFGDMRLAEFDVIRTADLLVQQDGRMFHTTYSLIWVQMLHDVWFITGHTALLQYCEKALQCLLERFEGYLGENGVLEHQPDHMFVDWTVIDGHSMHHPPKALGQTVLNAFYYKALTTAAGIYDAAKKPQRAAHCRSAAEQLRTAFNALFWDDEKQLYFDGLGTPHGGSDTYSPANVDKRYFSKYPNILAATYDLCDKNRARDLLERIVCDETLQDIQPYFAHYLLEALRRHGLFAQYGPMWLRRWVAVADECSKGLKEGWIAPEPTYSFDHSHAWGGTPAYQMPMALLGLEWLEPGCRRLRLTPELCGLEFYDIAFPTVYGEIRVRKEKGRPAQIRAPKAVTIELCE